MPFAAKDAQKQHYIYDALKTFSSNQFDEIDIYGRDLFGGFKAFEGGSTADTASMRNYYGDTLTATLRTTVILTTTVRGAKLEAWIVRVISGGRVVRVDALLQELKTFAERGAKLPDGVASQIKQSP